MKKFIALISVVALLLCSVSVIALAEEKTDTDYCAVLGDVDLSGKVQAEDARLALRKAVDLEEFDAAKMLRADLEEDSKITAADARLILRLAVELDAPYAHRYTAKVVKAEALKEAAKCTTAAEYYYSCAVCGNVEADDAHTFTDGDALGHDWKTTTVEAGWTEDGSSVTKCTRCDAVKDSTTSDAKMKTVADDANTWVENAGLNKLFNLALNDNELELDINVDDILNYEGATEGAFDGFLTKLGDYIKTNFNNAVVKIDGEEVYSANKLNNTTVKNILFSIGDGFFYNIANLDEDGVYGTYTAEFDGVEVALKVVFKGSKENLEKVKSFAEVISNHVYAIPGENLVIGIDLPAGMDAKIENAGGFETLTGKTVGECLAILASTDVESLIGTQVSAVNEICKLLGDDGVVAFANKVLDKIETATVKTEDGTEIAVFDKDYAPETADFAGVVKGVTAMFTDELKDAKIGDFKYVDDTDNEFGEGYFEIPVYVEVNMANADVMSGDTIKETVIVRIHF